MPESEHTEEDATMAPGSLAAKEETVLLLSDYFEDFIEIMIAHSETRRRASSAPPPSGQAYNRPDARHTTETVDSKPQTAKA